MTKIPVPPTAIRPSSSPGSWLVNDRRYYENAHALLEELEVVAKEVRNNLPQQSEAIPQAECDPALWKLGRRRDNLSDSVKVFSAMSVEAFLNFYGVLRLGQTYFDANVEALGPIKKLKTMFSLCEGIVLEDTDPLVRLLYRIKRRRDLLVHPRTIEVSTPPVDRSGDMIPQVARDAVADMVAFFEEFGRRDPDVSHHLPTNPDSAN